MNSSYVNFYYTHRETVFTLLRAKFNDNDINKIFSGFLEASEVKAENSRISCMNQCLQKVINDMQNNQNVELHVALNEEIKNMTPFEGNECTGQIVSTALDLHNYLQEINYKINYYKCADEVAKNLVLRTVTGSARSLILRKITDTGNSSDYQALLLCLKERYHKPSYYKNVLYTIHHSKIGEEEDYEHFGEKLYKLAELFKVLRPDYCWTDLFNQLETVFLRDLKHVFYYEIDLAIENKNFLALVKAVVNYLKRSPEEQFSDTTLRKMVDPSSILQQQENDPRLKNIRDNLQQSTKFQNYLLDGRGVLHWSHDGRSKNKKMCVPSVM